MLETMVTFGCVDGRELNRASPRFFARSRHLTTKLGPTCAKQLTNLLGSAVNLTQRLRAPFAHFRVVGVFA